MTFRMTPEATVDEAIGVFRRKMVLVVALMNGAVFGQVESLMVKTDTGKS